VTIISRLVELTQMHLVVEMLMVDQKQQSLKAVMWSNFTCIDPQTGKRKDHSPEFMELARTMEVHSVDLSTGLEDRVKQLQSQFLTAKS
jgi:acyl-CoA thioester hydrolase